MALRGHVPFCVFLLLAALSAEKTLGQQATGLPPFGSFSGESFDRVNNANLNVHFAIPIVSRAGRGLPFSYSQSYNTGIWAPVNSGSSTVWTPKLQWGWINVAQAVSGLVTFDSQRFTCGEPPATGTEKVWSNFQYFDVSGAPHTFPISVSYATGACGQGGSTDTEITKDGSGYTLTATASSLDGAVTLLLTDRSGKVLNNSAAPSSVTDTNGNQITLAGSSTVSVYDTLSSTTPVLTVSSSSPQTLTYTGPAGSKSYQINYTNYSVRTNFGCSGIVEYNSASQSLVSSVSLPDGTAYSFTYEATPGFPGSVTGRLHSVTLPTGGGFTYTYSGGSNGITCADGSPATLTRTTPDGVWTYAHTESGTAWTTTITDPAGNQTAMNFQGIYETQRQVKQGSTTVLETLNTCYNGAASPCNGTAITLPITQISTITTLGSQQSKRVTNLNSYGLPTEVDEYDFGTNAPGPVLRKTVTSYNTALGDILDHPASVTIENGAGTILSQTAYQYDQTGVTATSGTPNHGSPPQASRGNLTTITRQGLSGTFTYYDTGMIRTATDANNAQTTFNYPDSASTCGNSFPTSVSEPLSLTRSYVFNCNGGAVTQATDENGKNTSWAYNDPNFWRPTSTTDPTGAVTALSYFTSPNTGSEIALNFNGTASTADTRTTLDGLGRIRVTQRKQSPTSGNYDSVETDYDALGRPSRVTVPYTGTAGQTNATASATTTTYDALGRPLSVTDGGGGVTNYTYAQNDVLIEIDPAPAGEHAKKRQLEYDGLGRIRSVCEVNSSGSGGACGQNVAQTGFLTKYTYDAQDNLLTVNQNAQPGGSPQARTYTWDGLSRLTSEKNPETNGSGNSYTFDSDATCGTSKGDLVKRVDPAGNVTCYAYDALHRVTAMTYPSGPYAAATAAKGFVYDGATVNGAAMANAKGRLAEAYTGPSGAKVTDLGFSYSARGEVTDTYKSTPHSGGYYHVSASYWENGLRKTLATNLSVLPASWTYTPDGEGRVYSVAASSGQNPLTSTTYNGFGLATGLTLGSGDSDSFGYDATTGRETQYKFTVNGSSVVGNLTWNANGSLQQLAITDPFTASNTQTCTYSYGDFARLASANCGAVFSQTYGNDAFGNLRKGGFSGGIDGRPSPHT
jgi:YD repeat-containing protein